MALKLAAALAASLFFAGLAPAQTPTGSIVGRIADSSNAGVPGASVHAREVATNLARTLESQANGDSQSPISLPAPTRFLSINPVSDVVAGGTL
jgi:hypothetical protein